MVSIGLSMLEPEYRDILCAACANRMAILRKITLPKSLPEFFGALKVAIMLAFIGTNEIVWPMGRGLDALFESGATNGDHPLMFADPIALALFGIVLYHDVAVLERIFVGWAAREAG